MSFSAAALAGQTRALRPALPAVYLDTTYAPPAGRTLHVPAGGDLQAAFDAARPGDTLMLEAGATWVGNFILPPRPAGDDAWIVIRAAGEAELPPENRRVTPDYVRLPKLVSPNPEAALRAAPGAHHYRLIGVEFTLASEATFNYGLVKLGNGDEADPAQLPHHLILDRCYIHGHDGADISRGVALNSASSAVIDSHISQIHGRGFDTQAICGWNGPGPFKIANNYLEGAGENVLFGGADPAIAGLVPADIEVRQNTFHKPSRWRPSSPDYAGTHWSVKNLFELKNARRVLVTGNVMLGNWVDAQNGFAILFTPRNQDGRAPWSVVEDVTFSFNLLAQAPAVFNILGTDDLRPSGPARRIHIHDNLFYAIGDPEYGHNGRFLQVGGVDDLIVGHNTVLHTGPLILAHTAPNLRFEFTGNLAPNNEYGVVGDGTGPGRPTLDHYFPDARFKKNVIIGGQSDAYPRKKNYFPPRLEDVGFTDVQGHNYRLLATSPYKGAGTQGKDIGANIDEIAAAITVE